MEERNRTDNDFGGTDTQPFFFHWRSEFEDDSSAGGFTLKALERLDLTRPLPPGAQLAGEILRHCREQLAPYKRIRRLEFVDLPKTISGKIRRVDLRLLETERAGERSDEEYREEDFL